MSFLKISPSAHITSLGGGATAYTEGPSGIWSNPALAVLVDERSVQFTHIEWIEGINQEFAAFSTKSQIGHFGLAVNLFDSGDIELRNQYPSSEPDGIYSIKNVALSLTYAVKLTNDIALGVTAKKLYEKVSTENADGYAVDFGINVETPIKGISVACTARNYGRMGILRNDRTKLPSDVCLGALYRCILPAVEQSFVVVGDLIFPRYGVSGVRLGMEVEPFHNFLVRIGYRNDSDIQDVSYGIGVLYQAFVIDVSYTPMKEGFDNALRLTIGLSGF